MLKEVARALENASVELIARLVALRRPYRFRRAMGACTSLDNSRTVLVARPENLGDLVLAVPLLFAIREAMAPEGKLIVVAAPRFVSLLNGCPAVAETIGFDGSKGSGGRIARLLRLLSFGWKIGGTCGIGVAIVPRWDVDDHFATAVAYVCGAETRIGYSEVSTDSRRLHNRGIDRWFTIVVRDEAPAHELMKCMHILRGLGIDDKPVARGLWVSDREAQGARQAVCNALGREPLRIVAIVPGASHPRKIWPAASFVHVGRGLISRVAASIIVIGSPGEASLCRQIAEDIGPSAASIVGDEDLRSLVGLISICCLVISNDTGPKHIAAALGIPVVEVNAYPLDGDAACQSSPTRFGAWGTTEIVQPPHALPPCQRDCTAPDAHCITRVRPERVLAASLRLMGKSIKDRGPG